jgi:hypothetical protein
MPKSKYQFNKKSLQFEVVPITLKTRLLRLLSIIAAGSVFATVVIILAYNFLDSPKEKMLKRENEKLLMVIQEFDEKFGQVEAVVADMADRDDNIYRVIMEAEPVPTAYRKAGYGGSDRYSRMEGYKSSDMLISAAKKLDKITSQLVVQSKSFDEVYKMALNKEEMLACIPAIQPVSNTDLKRLSSYYGYRTDPIYKVRKFHSGIDFSAPTGTEVYATGNGIVKEVKSSRTGYGKQIVIDHGYGYETMYAHLHKFEVKRGQKIKRGQLIGQVGNTGKSTAPHLHYEIHKNGKTINPIYYFYNDLTPEEYEQVLEMSESSNQSFD